MSLPPRFKKKNSFMFYEWGCNWLNLCDWTATPNHFYCNYHTCCRAWVWTLILLSPTMKRMSSLYKSLVHPSIWSLNRKVDWHEMLLLFTSTRSHPAMQWSHSPNACLQSWDLIPCQITGATAATPATLIASESAGVQGRPAIFISTWLLAAGLPLSNV